MKWRRLAWRIGVKGLLLFGLPMLIVYIGTDVLFAHLDGMPPSAALTHRKLVKNLITCTVMGVVFGLFVYPRKPNP